MLPAVRSLVAPAKKVMFAIHNTVMVLYLYAPINCMPHLVPPPVGAVPGGFDDESHPEGRAF